MFQINLSVQGMSCGSCVNHVTKEIEALSDIQSVHVDLQSGRVQVQRILNQSDDLIRVLDAAGYPASLNLDGSLVEKPQPKVAGGCGGGGCCCG